jgi:hypothetical protein
MQPADFLSASAKVCFSGADGLAGSSGAGAFAKLMTEAASSNNVANRTLIRRSTVG